MKKGFIILCCCAFAVALFSIPTSVFAGSCNNLTIQHIGTNPSFSSGIEVWLKNESGLPCAEVPAGPAVQTMLSTTNTDQTLAVMLTAASLTKKVWVYLTGASAPYTIAFVQVKEITN